MFDSSYELSDRFDRSEGRLYLTGWDALVRLPLMQRAIDVAAGLNTAGYVSGYPGSPLGGLDSLLRAERERLKAQHVHFEPGLNEDIAATAISGTQYLGLGVVPANYDGVFGMWFGKGPGVKRSVDAMRTASYRGVAPHGGVLALAGDDHDARSTITAQQSETLFVHMHMPILNPSSIQEVIDYGLAGWALSRFCGSWVGFICLNDIVDSAATVSVDPADYAFVLPEDVQRPLPLGTPRPGAPGLGGAVAIEEEIRTVRMTVAREFFRANALDRMTLHRSESPSMRRTLGIITAGKTHLDVLDALGELNLTQEQAAGLGISVLKLAMTWPVDHEVVRRFAEAHDEILVVEPKHPIIEDQVGRLLWQVPADRRPGLAGKYDESGERLVPEHGALDASIVSRVLLRRLERLGVDEETLAAMRPRESLSLTPVSIAAPGGLVRAAGFCSGCPHSTSTKVPDGSFNIGGTGCHGMATMLDVPGRDTFLSTHMGGEGALWIGLSPFTDQPHTFQNVGDGTYNHSASLVVRAAVAAGTTMTFKVLLNGYISMTGGQAIPGLSTAQSVSRQLLSEGVTQVVVVTDEPDKYGDGPDFPSGVRVHERHSLLKVERELREVPGVTALVYDQACAAELRRERKRGRAPDPAKRVFINADVCEGCGDCNVQSNCISVEPLETDLGRKRRINQSSCNKDFTCVDGYCPSFVTVYGAEPRKRSKLDVAQTALGVLADPPTPEVAPAGTPYNIVVGGIGGGGVLTVGALLGMAAHVEGKSASVLNESGLAQKNGAVHSHVRVAEAAGLELSPRIGRDSADLLFGADMVVSAAAEMLSTVKTGTHAIVNADVAPTVAFAGSRDLDLSSDGMRRRLDAATGGRLDCLPASRLATRLMGDAIYSNLLLLGYAAQQGRLPVSVDAILRAIEINGVAIAANQEAFLWGRRAAVDLAAVERIAGTDDQENEPAVAALEPLSSLIDRRADFLTDYQDTAWAQKYRAAVARVAAIEAAVPGVGEDLTRAVAENLFKLMSYKDEYEVARLFVRPEFTAQLDETFEDGYTYKFNFAPQLLNPRDETTGRSKKWEIPSAVALPVLRGLSAVRRLRGTPLDVFGMSKHRQAERARIFDYLKTINQITAGLTADNHDLAVQIASLPQDIRGFDTIKDDAAADADQKQALLLAEFADRSVVPA